MHRFRLLSSLAALGVAAALAPAPVSAEPAAAAAKSPAPTGVTEKTQSALDVELTIKSFTLDNGLRVFVVEDHSVPAFSMHTTFNVGSRDEVEGRTGFAHLFEHMMFKGSDKVPDGGHFKHILGAGGNLNAFTNADVTQYFQIVPSHFLDMVLWLESDRLKSLAVTDENFENQRSAVKEERAMRYENPPYAGALLQFFAKTWEGTGYGHSTIGSQADLDAAKTADVKAFFNQYYVPNNATIAIVGDVEFDNVKAKIESYYGEIPRGADRSPRKSIDHAQKRLEMRVEDAHAQQPLYVLGWKTVPEPHPDRHALELLMDIMMRGDSSTLTKILKDDKKLVVATVPMPSMASGGRDAGSALAAFVPMPGKTFAEIQKVVLDEVETIKKKGISSKDLEKAKNGITVETVSQLATNNGRAFLIANSASLENDPFYILNELQKYQQVTARDIKRVANTYLTDKWLTLEIVPKG